MAAAAILALAAATVFADGSAASAVAQSKLASSIHRIRYSSSYKKAAERIPHIRAMQ